MTPHDLGLCVYFSIEATLFSHIWSRAVRCPAFSKRTITFTVNPSGFSSLPCFFFRFLKGFLTKQNGNCHQVPNFIKKEHESRIPPLSSKKASHYTVGSQPMHCRGFFFGDAFDGWDFSLVFFFVQTKSKWRTLMKRRNLGGSWLKKQNEHSVFFITSIKR